ncbi:MAG: hypothetical protein ABIN97_00055 [Ginsengibacter sp.]
MQTPKDENTKSDSTSGDDASAPRLIHVDGFMDTLYIDTLKFMTFTERRHNRPPKRLAFNYYLKDLNTLTLCAWKRENNTNNYDRGDSLELKNGAPSSQNPIEPGLFIGNVVLNDVEVRSIRDSIRHRVNRTMGFLVFAPAKDTPNLKRFKYTIMLSDHEPFRIQKDSVPLLPKAIVKPIIVNANPSPPKTQT